MLRAILFITIIAVLGTSCRTAKAPARPIRYTGIKDPTSASPSKRVYKDAQRSGRISMERMASGNPYINIVGDIETSNPIQFKYALLTDVPVEALKNINLLNYLDAWYGTPYRYGGATHSGIDCSAFSMALMTTVFGVPIPRTVKAQFEASQRIDKADLHEGDLVFFNTTRALSHVGVYLLNNRFAHASTTGGVMVSDLDEDYFLKRYAGAGRVK